MNERGRGRYETGKERKIGKGKERERGKGKGREKRRGRENATAGGRGDLDPDLERNVTEVGLLAPRERERGGDALKRGAEEVDLTLEGKGDPRSLALILENGEGEEPGLVPGIGIVQGLKLLRGWLF